MNSTPLLLKTVVCGVTHVLGIGNILDHAYKGSFTVNLNPYGRIICVTQILTNYKTRRLDEQACPRVWKRLQAKVDSILAEEALY